MSTINYEKKKRSYKDLLEFIETKYYIRDLKNGVNTYLSVLQRYINFTGKNPKELIDEAQVNIKKAKIGLFEFGEFLKENGLSNRTIRQYLGSKLGRFFRYNMTPIIWTKMDLYDAID